MSKGRSAVKYSVAGAATVLYGLAATRQLLGLPEKKASPKQVAIVAIAMAAATWVVALA